MQNGSGMGLFINVGEKNLHFKSSGSQYITCAPGTYTSTVGGHEPSSATLTILFKDDGQTIGSQTFATPTFFGYIPFTVI